MKKYILFLILSIFIYGCSGECNSEDLIRYYFNLNLDKNIYNQIECSVLRKNKYVTIHITKVELEKSRINSLCQGEWKPLENERKTFYVGDIEVKRRKDGESREIIICEIDNGVIPVLVYDGQSSSLLMMLSDGMM